LESVEGKAVAVARDLCLVFEGMYLKPYLCPANVPTLGVGSTFYEDGTRVSLADPAITRARAMALLEWELNHCLPRVKRLCPGLADWGDQATGAILDFAFNCGTGALQGSTLRKRINADDVAGAKAELMKWTRGGGRVLPGLVKRRAAEVALLP
jgi:lysozyme